MVKFIFVYQKSEVLYRLKFKSYLASSVSSYGFSTIYFTLPHNVIIEKLTEITLKNDRDDSHYLASNEKCLFHF